MYRPIVFNRYLNEKWSSVNNEIMKDKLINVKAKVNARCPESFSFYKNKFTRTAEKKTKMQQYEIARNNEIMFYRLIKVEQESQNNKLKNKMRLYSLKGNKTLAASSKFEIIKIAQDNQHMFKRITERRPFYSIMKWENDYEKHLYYKQKHCMFPSINFVQTEGNHRFTTSYSKKRKINYFNTTNQTQASQKVINEDTVNLQTEGNQVLPRILYKNINYIDLLGQCNCEFSIQEMSFTIKIEPLKNKGNGYIIIFDTRESIESIQKYYLKYEEMIKDITYDNRDDHVSFNNKNKPDLICRSIKLPPNGNVNNKNESTRETIDEEKEKEFERRKEKEKQLEIQKQKEQEKERQNQIVEQQEYEKQREIEKQNEEKKAAQLQLQPQQQDKSELKNANPFPLLNNELKQSIHQNNNEPKETPAIELQDQENEKQNEQEPNTCNQLVLLENQIK